MTNTTESRTGRVRAPNDAFRRSFVGGAVMINQSVEAMPSISAVQSCKKSE